MLLGAHVRGSDPIAAAEQRAADCVQVFLSNPQSWKKPAPREDGEALRSAGIPIYVHAPYLINVASPNNRVRIPSRKILADTCAAAEEIGAAGVIVHGGHLTESEEPLDVGFDRWRKALESLETSVPILIENTAGGENAIAREVAVIGRLWAVLGDFDVGFCLDTCHAWASGEALDGIVKRLIEATGRIDLVHCNDSRDPFDSRRDRHANLGQGEIPPELIIEVVREADAPVIVETPGEPEEQAADIRWLRDRLDS
jgi:deoxyribonuclease-4